MIGFYHHKLFEEHLKGYGHCERPERISGIMKRIKSSPIAKSITFMEATPAEIEWIERVHDRKYIDFILSLEIPEGGSTILDWGDTVATSATAQAALHAAGCSVMAVRKVLAGEFSTAFCAVRPPGHHAERDRAMGFCIFNNDAIAVADLLENGGLKRVAIIDWDVHHGNGTEQAFFEDDRVLYISLHQYPHFPGTGHSDVIGSGRGTGYTINIPMPPGARDDQYLDAFNNRVLPALDDYKPEFILITAGFDGHMSDYLAETNLSSQIFGTFTELVRERARHHCQGRIVSILAGGYNLDALAESVEIHLTELAK